MHLLRGTADCALVADDNGGAEPSLLSAAEASRALTERLAPLRLTVHYEGSATEACLIAPDWQLEDAVGICPSVAGFAVPRRSVVHHLPASLFPRLRGNDDGFPAGFEVHGDTAGQPPLHQWW